jgi:hypothetical protein
MELDEQEEVVEQPVVEQPVVEQPIVAPKPNPILKTTTLTSNKVVQEPKGLETPIATFDLCLMTIKLKAPTESKSSNHLAIEDAKRASQSGKATIVEVLKRGVKISVGEAKIANDAVPQRDNGQVKYFIPSSNKVEDGQIIDCGEDGVFPNSILKLLF